MTEDPEFRRERMTDPSAQLLRPIIHQWVTADVVNFEAFKLSTADKKDSNRLSIARGAATSAEQAYRDRADAVRRRCEDNGRPYIAPVGVLGLDLSEVESVEIKSPSGDSSRQPLTVWDDSMNSSRPDDHGHIDYNELPPSDKGAYTLVAKTLVARAQKNGWKYKP